MNFKYVRIQGRELSYVTKQPKGIFAMCWRKIYDGVKEEQDAELFKRINAWFEENIPIPDKYNHPYDVVYTDFVGEIVYEDAFQIAVRV